MCLPNRKETILGKPCHVNKLLAKRNWDQKQESVHIFAYYMQLNKKIKKKRFKLRYLETIYRSKLKKNSTSENFYSRAELTLIQNKILINQYLSIKTTFWLVINIYDSIYRFKLKIYFSFPSFFENGSLIENTSFISDWEKAQAFNFF